MKDYNTARTEMISYLNFNRIIDNHDIVEMALILDIIYINRRWIAKEDKSNHFGICKKCNINNITCEHSWMCESCRREFIENSKVKD